MRAIALIFVVLAGCGSDTNVADLAAGDIGVAGPDLAVCTHGVGPAPNVSTPCGPLTCAPGQICVEHLPPFPIPDMAYDGGAQDGGYSLIDYECWTLPPECQSCGGCGNGTPGAGGSQFGCFLLACPRNIGREETGCFFDGATLQCAGI